MKLLKVLSTGRVAAFALAFFIGSAGAAMIQQDMSDEAIAERIKPVGKVHIAGAEAASAAASGPRSGEQVYNTFCSACHGTGALGAPKHNDPAAWGPRVEQGMETLLSHAINGLNAMPPKGTCSDCSEDEIKAAIEFMTEGV